MNEAIVAGEYRRYVLGFMFDKDDHEQVGLIRKKRPDWQNGLLNGIGGKVESDEFYDVAIIREFLEETDVLMFAWDHFLTLSGDNYSISCYRCFGDLSELKTAEDEEVVKCYVGNLNNGDPLYETVPNLKWIIPLAMSPYVDSANVHESLSDAGA